MQNVFGPTPVAMAMKFGLGAEIQSPTGLFCYYSLLSFNILVLSYQYLPFNFINFLVNDFMCQLFSSVSLL